MGSFEYAVISFDEGWYDEDIMERVADIFDVGVNECGVDGRVVGEAFIASGIADEFERHNPAFVAGRSGCELLDLMFDRTGISADVPDAPRLSRTEDYWVGWSVAAFQLATSRPYERLLRTIPYHELRELYHPLHEADESKFVSVVEQRIERAGGDTRLKAIREASGLSQTQLAMRSHVGLRSIQMYEQRNKDINKAQSVTLMRLSRALACEMEDLMER